MWESVPLSPLPLFRMSFVDAFFPALLHTGLLHTGLLHTGLLEYYTSLQPEQDQQLIVHYCWTTYNYFSCNLFPDVSFCLLVKRRVTPVIVATMQTVKQLCPQFLSLMTTRSFNHNHRNLHHLYTLMSGGRRGSPPLFFLSDLYCPFRFMSSLTNVGGNIACDLLLIAI